MDWGCMHLTKVRHVKSLTAGSGTLLQSRHHLQETAVISGGVYMNLHRSSPLGSILGAHLGRSLLAKPWRSPPDRMSWASGFTQGLGWMGQWQQNRVVNSLNMLMSLKNMEVHSNHKLWFMHWFNPPYRVFYQPCHCRIRKAIRAWYSCFAPKEVFPAIGNTQDVGFKFQFNRSQSTVGIHRNLGSLILSMAGTNERKKTLKTRVSKPPLK